MDKSTNFKCKYLISSVTKNKSGIKTKGSLCNYYRGLSENFYFPIPDEVQAKCKEGTKFGMLAIDPWPAFASSRGRSDDQIYVTPDCHLICQGKDESKLPSVNKPRFLDMLENKIKNDTARFSLPKDVYNPVRLQIYVEAFELFIQHCVYYRPFLAKVKSEYELCLDYLRSEIKKLLPIKEMLWTVSQEYEQRANAMQNKENYQIEQLKDIRKGLIAKIEKMKQETIELGVTVSHLTLQLEEKADEWRTEVDGRKILVTDVNDLTSRLREMEQLARAELEVNQEDPVKLRIALDQCNKALSAAQAKIVVFEASYESMVPSSKFEEIRTTLDEERLKYEQLTDEQESLRSRYDILQEHYITLNTYRDIYYIQVTYVNRVLGAKGDSSQKVEYLVALLGRWRRLIADKSFADLTRIATEEMVKVESGTLPVIVRGSRNRAVRSIHEGKDTQPKEEA